MLQRPAEAINLPTGGDVEVAAMGVAIRRFIAGRESFEPDTPSAFIEKPT
jgi:hypothetical protein